MPISSSARLLGSISALFLLFTAPTFAEGHQAVEKPGQISVSAEGRISAAPDLAIMQLSVVREAKTAREALTANNNAMADIVDEMKKEGIEPRDLQTAGISIQPRYVYDKASNGRQKPPRIDGYIVSNALTVRVRDLQSIGTLLDRSVTLGVNQGGNIQFMVEDTEALLKEARIKAMKNAIAKAEALTNAAGVKLGRILSISEANRGGARPQMMARAMKSADMAMESSVPVEAGEARYSTNVSITYEIDQ